MPKVGRSSWREISVSKHLPQSSEDLSLDPQSPERESWLGKRGGRGVEEGRKEGGRGEKRKEEGKGQSNI